MAKKVYQCNIKQPAVECQLSTLKVINAGKSDEIRGENNTGDENRVS